MKWGESLPDGQRTAILAACALLLPAAASGQAPNAISPIVEEKRVYEDNVFRLSNSANSNAVIGSSSKADSYRVTTFGLSLDIPVNRQRLVASFAVNDSRYQRFAALNFAGHDLRASWLWEVGSKASGQLGYSDSSTLASFANILGTAPDQLKLRHAFANGSLMVTPRWRIQAAANAIEQRNGGPASKVNDVDIADGELAFSYLTPAGSSFGLRARAEDGSFPSRQPVAGLLVDNAYRQRRVGLVMEWPVTVASQFSGRIDRLSRRYEQLPQRDYEGTTTRLQYDWKPTGKIELTAIAQRDLSPFENVRSSFVRVKGLTLRPTYNATAKLQISGVFNALTREYLGDPALALELAPVRRDHVRSAGVLLAYRPLDTVTVQLSVLRETRASNVAFGDYAAKVVSISVRLAF